MNNIQHFLLANEKAIESIPSLVERLELLEDALFSTPDEAKDEAFPYHAYQEAHHELFTTDSSAIQDLVEEEALAQDFDQGDHDELFAAGGATKRSFEPDDWAEVFSDVPVAASPVRNHPNI